MKRQSHFISSLAAGGFLLAGISATAQATSGTKPLSPHSGASSSHRASEIAVDHAGGNGVRRAAGNSGGNKKSGESERMKQSPSVHQPSGNTQTREDTKSGDNPMYESKDKANLKPRNNKATRNPIAVDHAGGNRATGLAVNEQGSSTAVRRHRNRH
jgi:hypothetical protein